MSTQPGPQTTTSPIPQRRGWTKPVAATVALLGILALGAAFAKTKTDVDDEFETATSNAIHVRVVIAGQVQAPATYSRYRGTVQSRRESRLGFRRGGRIKSVLVHEGDRVSAGDVLAELDVADLNAQQRQSVAQLDAARAELSEALAGPRQQTIDAAIADVNRITAELASANADFDRESLLRRRGAGTERGFDNARFAKDSINASLTSAQARLGELQAGTRPEQIEAAKAAVAVAQAALSRIDVDLADSRIVAPYDGQISLRMIDEGTIVSPDAITLHIIESPPLEARFGLPDSVAQQLAKGEVLSVASTLGSVDASVVRIHPTLDLKTRTRSVDLQFAGDADVVPGQTVTLSVAVNTDSADASMARFWVPTPSLVRSSRGLWSVMVATPDSDDPSAPAIIERRDVRVLQTSGHLSQVTGMVQRGDAIVATGTHRVSPGVNVIVANGTRSAGPMAAAEQANLP